jgi:tRNA uridine 5-carboxymethylaminomethyl modification enzyme
MDNADKRLTPLAYKIGMIERECYEKMKEKYSETEKIMSSLSEVKITPKKYKDSEVIDAKKYVLNKSLTLSELLRRPEITREFLVEQVPELKKVCKNKLDIILYEIKYEGYIKNMKQQIAKMKNMENTLLPEKFDYRNVISLSFEAAEKLNKIQPRTLGQASRITGVRNGDITVLMIYLKKNNIKIKT